VPQTSTSDCSWRAPLFSHFWQPLSLLSLTHFGSTDAYPGFSNMSRIAKRQPWRSLSQQGSSSAIRSSSLPIPTINTRIYPTTPVSGISIGSGRPFSTSFGRLVEQGPTKPPPLPPAGLNKPLEGKTKNVESRQKKKDEDEDGEVQTPVPSPLNIPGGGIPGFGHTFTNKFSLDAALTTVVGLAMGTSLY